MAGASNPDVISTKLRRVAEVSRQAPDLVWNTLAHHIDREMLKEAYGQVRKDGAVGVDGQTADEYAAELEENLQSLLDRFKSGSYKAPPVRRASIPKGDGKGSRTIGIPTFEDKILQRAVTMVLEAVYEQDFLDCSYGFRPGRSAHQALEAFWRKAMWMGGGYVLKLDIEKFFDAEAAAGKDTVDPVYQTGAEEQERRSSPSGDVRLARLHPLLGHVPQEAVGDQAQNCQGPFQSVAKERIHLVQGEPAYECRGAATKADAQAQRPLPVLRHHWELRIAGAFPLRSEADMAEVA